jgi:hypothetical protein
VIPVQRRLNAAERTALQTASDWNTFKNLAGQYSIDHSGPPRDPNYVEVGEDVGDIAMAPPWNEYRWAADTFRYWFKDVEQRAILPLKTARAYVAAGLDSKADYWYRVVRRGFHKDKNGIRKALVPAVPGAAELAEANDWLSRLGAGRVPLPGVLVKQLEENSGQFEQQYRKEMKAPAPGSMTNIAVTQLFIPYLAKYKKAITDSNDALKATISRDCLDRGLPDPATLVSATSAPNIDAALETAALQSVGSYQVAYLAGTARAALELQGGPVIVQAANPAVPYSTQGLFSTHNGTNWALFVMDASGGIYATGHRVSRMHHSSPLSGGDVAAAGEIAVNNGTVVGVTNKSGHYTPDQRHTVQMLNVLAARGVNLGNVKLRFHDATGGPVFWDTNAAGFVADTTTGQFATKLATLKAAVLARRNSRPQQKPFDVNEQVPIF